MIVVYGTVCLDRLRTVPHLPGPGSYVEIQTEMNALGGEAANSAAALNSWGDEVVLVGNSLGQGAAADEVKRQLSLCGLGGALLPERDHQAPYCDIYVTPDGERTMFGWGFEAMHQWHGLDLLPLAPGLLLTVDANHGPSAREAVRRGREAGMRLYTLDLAEDEEPLGADVLWQSSTVWTGTAGKPEETEAWMKAFQAKHGCLMILTEGEKGVWVLDRSERLTLFPSYPAPVMVDATGAGDAFRAGMLHGLDHSWPFNRCLAFASATGALACGRLGGAANAPSLDAIESLMGDHPEILAKFLSYNELT